MKWNKGKPPHIGWWNASNSRERKAWRWWDGRIWSSVCFDDYSRAAAKDWASVPDMVQSTIEWRTFYPVNARVKRRKP